MATPTATPTATPAATQTARPSAATPIDTAPVAAHHAAPFRLKADALLPLSARRDAPAAWRALGHLGAIAAAATALWSLRGTAWAVPLVLLLGYFVAFLFNPLHETAHQTAFRSRACNYVLGHLAGFALVLPYEYYRAFHWDHHRHTQDPARDPELASPPPASLPALAWYVLGPPVWYGRIRTRLRHAAGHVTEPWVPAGKRALIVREARLYLLGYALVIGASVATRSVAALWLWVLPMVVGQLFIRPYLLSEHTGCPHSPNMLENTRTTYTHRFVHFFAWNMPYHVEHHAYPAVPFHALPRLNALLAPHIVHTERGYPASFAAVVRHVRRRATPCQRPDVRPPASSRPAR